MAHKPHNTQQSYDFINALLSSSSWHSLENYDIRRLRSSCKAFRTVLDPTFSKIRVFDASVKDLQTLACLERPYLETLNISLSEGEEDASSEEKHYKALGDLASSRIKWSLKNLTLSMNWREDPSRQVVSDSLCKFLSAFPGLKSLKISAYENMLPIIAGIVSANLPELEELRLEYYGEQLQTGATRLLSAGQWPKLHTLELRNIISAADMGLEFSTPELKGMLRRLRNFTFSCPVGNFGSKMNAVITRRCLEALQGSESLETLTICDESPLILPLFGPVNLPNLTKLSLSMHLPRQGAQNVEDLHSTVYENYYDGEDVDKMSDSLITEFFAFNCPTLKELSLAYEWEDEWLTWRQEPVVGDWEGNVFHSRIAFPAVEKMNFFGFNFSDTVMVWLRHVFAQRCKMGFAHCKRSENYFEIGGAQQ